MPNSRNRKLVPECDKAIQQWKYELAGELGIAGFSSSGFESEMAGELGSIGGASTGSEYWGNITAREAGTIGGNITKRLVQLAEQQAQQTIL
ncbi:small, acid-soluble spore protein, alpha/beta type [Cohnella sp. CFH 77786]|uniref:alpha/beta-type small acid-soluble spore protein n=1 Tax=Cohnella sp. CFH 77786 TaxID=2662265 RepID=UPI001C60C216|nr:alpha/beta-type small acid-soluble spore protein [Cohnella sp. CFH 77786]MBW5448495.1 small, acid-soluble spore protein, alpha/beta type [Cohnella sp. CFH 77786]